MWFITGWNRIFHSWSVVCSREYTYFFWVFYGCTDYLDLVREKIWASKRPTWFRSIQWVQHNFFFSRLRKNKVGYCKVKWKKISRIYSQCSKVLRRTHEDVWKLRKEISEMEGPDGGVTKRLRAYTHEAKHSHLDIIADDNPAKCLIKSLIRRVPGWF